MRGYSGNELPGVGDGDGRLEPFIPISAWELAGRFIGLRERPGAEDNVAILAALRLVNREVAHDEVPWCSAFCNAIAWLLGLPRSNSLAARSWLHVGRAVPLSEAMVGFDVVVLSRGALPQPGPNVLKAQGHVGFFGGLSASGRVVVRGGNQGDAVSDDGFDPKRVLGVRRLVDLNPAEVTP